MIEYTETENTIVFSLRVMPRSSRSEIVGVLNGALKIKIAAPPVEGAANGEVIKFIARSLGVPRSCVSITAGHNSRSKRVSVRGVMPEQLQRLAGE